MVILSASVKCFAGVYFGNCVNQKAQENDHFSCCCDQENNHATAMLYGLVDGRTGFINFNWMIKLSQMHILVSTLGLSNISYTDY